MLSLELFPFKQFQVEMQSNKVQFKLGGMLFNVHLKCDKRQNVVSFIATWRQDVF